MEAGIITAIVALTVGCITAIFTFRGKRDENNIAEIQTVMTSYKEVVQTLNHEIFRLKAEIEELRTEMSDCDERNQAMEQEIAELRSGIAELKKELGK